MTVDEYVNRNIDRVIKQCRGGDEAMSFLAIYSFIEGYFRNKYPEKLKFCVENRNLSFSNIMDYAIREECRSESSSSKKHLYELLKYYHGKSSIIPEMELNTGTDTNMVRHCFSLIEENTLQVIVNQFIEFAELNGFASDFPELRELNRLMKNKFSSLGDSTENPEIRESDGYPAPSSLLLTKIEEILYCIREKDRLNEELDNLQADFMSSDSYLSLNSLFERKKRLNNELKNVTGKLLELSEYIHYLDGLYRSIAEAQCRKSFESRIIRLSQEQKDLILYDIYRKSVDNPGRSLYIKGGPGTGKTLVLIASLLKLYKQNVGRTCLLTFYPTLNKYISYLFALFNNSEVLKNNLEIDKLDSFALQRLTERGIKKFDSFLIDQILDVLSSFGIIPKKEVYSAKNNKEHLMNLFTEITGDIQSAKEIYRDIIETILPNGIDTVDKFCIYNETNKHKWPLIEKALNALKNEERILDSYLYYLFYTSGISDDAFSADHFDYILIDEAQDLTNAQIFAVNKFVSKSGGLILAGDPSQEIRNKRLVQWSELGVTFREGPRFDAELVTNFRSSEQIQNLGNNYKNIDYLRINKNTQSVDGKITGPNPQLYISSDTEETHYGESIEQIIQSVKMCVYGLDIIPSNITIVSFGEKELFDIQKRLMDETQIDSVMIHKTFQFRECDEKVRLCTLENIKGIDCPILMFLITDQTREENSGNIPPILKANAIYTCITRAMFLLQVFIPNYCIKSDNAVAALINLLNPNDEDLNSFMDTLKAKYSKIIPLSWFPQKKDEHPETYVKRVKQQLMDCCKEKYKDNDNIEIQIVSNLEDPSYAPVYAMVYAIKKVVKHVCNGNLEIEFDDAVRANPGINLGDDFPVYIPPSELEGLIRKPVNGSLNSGSDDNLAKILIDIYNDISVKNPDRLEDENGKPSSNGYLNIAGCVPLKPFAYGSTYNSWPEFIKSMGDKFEYVKIPYERGLGDKILYKFAFRPINNNNKAKKTVTTPERNKKIVIIPVKRSTNANEDKTRFERRCCLPPEWELFCEKHSHKFQPIILEKDNKRIKSFSPQGDFEGVIDGFKFDRYDRKYYIIKIDNLVEIRAFPELNPSFNDLKTGDRVVYNIEFSFVGDRQLPKAINIRRI